MWFQKISINTSWMVTGNSAGFGGSQRPKLKKNGVKGNWNFWRGGVFKVKTSMGEVWIFSLEPHNGKQCGRRLADLGFSIPTT